MERIVLHSDLNNFYASVERILNPDLQGKPVAVCGNEEERRGIVLAKSEEAKKFGIKTGDTVWQARRKCPAVIIVRPHFNEYMSYSRKVKAIYARYTDQIESYGIDECWLDVTKSTKIFPAYDGEMYVEGGGAGGANGERHFSDGFLRHIGDTIRFAVKNELGLTVSVGVSFNKIYAKLGSDLKKPNGTSVISLLNYKNVIFGLPVKELLMVGGATESKLCQMGYTTIGKLAAADDSKVIKALGKFGQTLLTYARGEDETPVRTLGDDRELKSIGNSLTCPKDLTDYNEVKRTLYVLSESVAARLRESGLGLADTVHLWVRDSALNGYQVQKKVRHTCLCGEIAEHAFLLFKEKFSPPFAVRALGVTVSGFDKGLSQLTFDETAGDYLKRERAERCVDEIRKKHGYAAVQRGIVAEDPAEMHNDIKGTHLIKPAKFDDNGN
ncbi:MAG: DNA polymerase IV [Clostridiales bacterium]|nr:DNA polymerase IV [Clostridiales bacterium]